MTREDAKKFREELNEFLKTKGKEYSVTGSVKSFTLGGAFAKLSIELRTVNEEGEREFTRAEHSMANIHAMDRGLVFHDNILGSYWEINDTYYKVIEFSSRRPKYPFILLNVRVGNKSKCGVGFINSGHQIHKSAVEMAVTGDYTYEDFKKWLYLDPESDTISREDEDICDAINDYLTFNVSKEVEVVDLFFDTISRVEETENFKGHTYPLYKMLFLEKNMYKAIDLMESLL